MSYKRKRSKRFFFLNVNIKKIPRKKKALKLIDSFYMKKFAWNCLMFFRKCPESVIRARNCFKICIELNGAFFYF